MASQYIGGAFAALLLAYLGGFAAFRATHPLTGHLAVPFYLLPASAQNRAIATLYRPLFWMLGERVLIF